MNEGWLRLGDLIINSAHIVVVDLSARRTITTATKMDSAGNESPVSEETWSGVELIVRGEVGSLLAKRVAAVSGDHSMFRFKDGSHEADVVRAFFAGTRERAIEQVKLVRFEERQWQAYLLGETPLSAAGETADEALGRLARDNPNRFGFGEVAVLSVGGEGGPRPAAVLPR
jgi:hypothetical protein